MLAFMPGSFTVMAESNANSKVQSKGVETIKYTPRPAADVAFNPPKLPKTPEPPATKRSD